ncbi:hypothetical protein [Bombilactobacillus bombi]|uniref:hypothetical protein n=1 Tax=Bombilactobacillus bombi TaxID=1303590 RepID=UPI0015E5FCF6|nr:hypothetical protein [Bombilactobacillus bombi]MBA1433719.1 hypothetical protein [Bombilactobacillus bombi]
MKTIKSRLLLRWQQNWLYILIFGVIFCYFALFRYFLIPSGDDFFWWGESGNYLLHHHFLGAPKLYGGSLNGRYLGNLLEIFSMRHLKLAVLVFGGAWTLLIWSLWQLGGKTWWSLVLATGFIFTLNDAFLNAILVWNAGFSNYVPSIALVLLYLVIVKKGEQQSLGKIYSVITLIIGLCAGLFLETLTVVQVILGILVLFWFTSKKSYQITYLIGALSSLGIMFSYPGYRLNVPYRKITFDLHKIWQLYSNYNHLWLISLNTLFLTLLLAAMFIIINRSAINRLLKVCYLAVAGIFLLYFWLLGAHLLSVPKDHNYEYLLSPTLANIDAVMSIFLVIYVGTFIYQFFPKDRWLWLYYLTVGLFVGPLVFVASPINCRAVFPAYIFMYLILISFFQRAMKLIKINRLLFCIATLAILVAAASYQVIMHANYAVSLERVQNPQYLQGKSGLNKHVPYRKFVWADDVFNQQIAPQYWKARLQK